MRKIAVLALAAIVIALAGCAPMPSTLVHPGPIPEMVPDKNSSVVTFFRESRFVAGGLPYSLRESGPTIGVLKNGTYFSFRTTPGSHTYTVEAIGKPSESIAVIVEPNATTYIQVNFFAWGLGQFFSLEEVPPVTAKAAIQKLKYIELRSDDANKNWKPGG